MCLSGKVENYITEYDSGPQESPSHPPHPTLYTALSLSPPVLSVWLHFLQADQSVPGSVQGETSDPVSPLLLCPERKEIRERVKKGRSTT